MSHEVLKTLALQNKFFHAKGLYTLLTKEIRRFSKLFTQTIVSPLITTLLYLMVFGVGFKQHSLGANGLSYLEFLIPGLTAMSIINNAFGNTTASVMGAKYQQTLTELFFTPLAPWEMATALLLGGVMRGLAVAVSTLAVCWWFDPFTLAHPIWIFISIVMLSIIFGGLGIVTALWANNFDKLSYFTTFFIAPLSFLGGVFFSIAKLPQPWQTIASLNPLVYFTNFFRWSCIGYADLPVFWSGLILVLLTVGIFMWTVYLYERGYKIKS